MHTLDGNRGSADRNHRPLCSFAEIDLYIRSTSDSRPGRSCSRKGMAFCFSVAYESKDEIRLDEDRKIQFSACRA